MLFFCCFFLTRTPTCLTTSRSLLTTGYGTLGCARDLSRCLSISLSLCLPSSSPPSLLTRTQTRTHARTLTNTQVRAEYIIIVDPDCVFLRPVAKQVPAHYFCSLFHTALFVTFCPTSPSHPPPSLPLLPNSFFAKQVYTHSHTPVVR